jgi:hypothetical protein
LLATVASVMALGLGTWLKWFLPLVELLERIAARSSLSLRRARSFCEVGDGGMVSTV